MRHEKSSQSALVTVLIAEADRMNCQLIQNAFSRGRRGIVAAGAAVDSADALSVLKEHEPDIAIVSARLLSGPVEGFALVRSIRRLKLRTRIIMLLDSRERDVVVDAFRFGTHGVIFRDEPLETLSKCIFAVNSGQIWANGLQMGYVADALTQAMPIVADNLNGATLLTSREKDIIKLLAQGMSNRQIAAQLSLSEHTIRNYLQHVFDKLGVSTRVELLLYWMYRSSLIPGTSPS